MLAFGICHVLMVKPHPGTVTPPEHGTSHSVPFSLLHGHAQGSSEQQQQKKAERHEKYCAF